MIEVFKQLEDPKHRNARRVYRLSKVDAIEEAVRVLADMNALKEEEFRMVKVNDPVNELNINDIKHKVNANYLESKGMVKADFEHVGVLVRNKLIPAEELMKVYWYDITLLSEILKHEIEQIRINNSSYMANFSNLARRCEEWCKKNSLSKVSVNNYNEETFMRWINQ